MSAYLMPIKLYAPIENGLRENKALVCGLGWLGRAAD
jgi:hypothetical protein